MRRNLVFTDRNVNWTVVPAPNEGWARQVFGEPDVERLWDAVAVATRLDEPDLVDVWKKHSDKPKLLYHARFPEYIPDDVADALCALVATGFGEEQWNG